MRRRADPWESRVSQWGSLRFDHDAMTLFCEDQRIALTQREAEVMALLIRRVGQWVTNREISMHMSHGLPGVLRPATVQLYVHRINRKIAPHGWHVHCVKRVGYGLKFQPASAAAAIRVATELPAATAHRPFASAWVPSDTGVVSP